MAHFIVFDGLDGVGKGTILKAVKDYLSQSKSIFDLVNYWKKNNSYPDFEYINHYDVIFSAEPTYCGTGRKIREVIINKKYAGKFSAQETAQAYAEDRHILYEKIILPALAANKIIIQDRSVTSSLTYQRIQAEEQGENLTLDYIINLPGNNLALNNIFNLLVIPSVSNVEEVFKRMDNRDKTDNVIFERIAFQKKLKEAYESSWFRDILESRGATIEFLDASISEHHTKNEAARILKNYLKI